MLRRKRINRYKKILLPEASLTATTLGPQVTFGVTTTVVQSDKSYVDSLVNTMDTKSSLYVSIAMEDSSLLLESVKEIRGAALNTVNLVERLDIAELCRDIVDACRIFMNTYNTSHSAHSQSLAIEAMRRGVLSSASALIELCSLPVPRNLPVHQYQQAGLVILEDMLTANSEVTEALQHQQP